MAPPSHSHRTAAAFEVWNRKVHYYLGLYFLFFLWLFSFTGLLLNHSWKFAEFWPNRRISTTNRLVSPPAPADVLRQARELMGQLGIEGEVEWATQRNDPARLDFRVSRPGHTAEIRADLVNGTARIEETTINGWGLARVLHTFTGVRMNDPNRRDWILTTIWALSMDALAFGLILMVLSSFYMWWRLKAKRTLGLAVLLLGFLSCGFFVFGLRWFY
jgi:hypothetical protein